MNEKLLKEHIGRVGLVTLRELIMQTGYAANLLRQPVLQLMGEKEIFLCRMDHGRETLVARHLIFCLQTIQSDPNLSAEAQDLYDWVSENENASMAAMQKYSGLSSGDFPSALRELQELLCIAPVKMCKEIPQKSPVDLSVPIELEKLYEFLWVTDDYWKLGLPRPARYRDLEYSLSEVRRLMRSHFSTREINELLYHIK